MKEIKKTVFVVIISGLMLLLLGCGGGKSSSSTKDSQGDSQGNNQNLVISDETKAEAKQIFVTTCAACHGAGGKGDGPASASLTPPPRNLTSAEWQDSVDDEYLAKIIQYGGAAVGKSVAMPSNPSLSANPELLQALIQYIRGIKE